MPTPHHAAQPPAGSPVASTAADARRSGATPRIDASHAASNSEGPTMEKAEIRAAGGFDPSVLGDHFVRQAEELAVRLQTRHQQLQNDSIESAPKESPLQTVESANQGSANQGSGNQESARIRLRDLANELDRQRAQLDRDFRSLQAERETMEKDKRVWAAARGSTSTARSLTKSTESQGREDLGREDLDQQRHQLRAFGIRLADKYREFAQQREQFQQWAEKREAELQHRAEEVNGRITDLEAEHRRHLSMQHEWSHTCRQQQRQIRNLMLQLDQLANLLDKKHPQ